MLGPREPLVRLLRWSRSGTSAIRRLSFIIHTISTCFHIFGLCLWCQKVNPSSNWADVVGRTSECALDWFLYNSSPKWHFGFNVPFIFTLFERSMSNIKFPFIAAIVGGRSSFQATRATGHLSAPTFSTHPHFSTCSKPTLPETFHRACWDLWGQN